VSPLLVVFAIAMVLRVAMGSATVGIISAAGIVAPIVKGIPGYSPEIIVLALCCGGSGPSHVNDSGFLVGESILRNDGAADPPLLDRDEDGRRVSRES